MGFLSLFMGKMHAWWEPKRFGLTDEKVWTGQQAIAELQKSVHLPGYPFEKLCAVAAQVGTALQGSSTARKGWLPCSNIVPFVGSNHATCRR